MYTHLRTCIRLAVRVRRTSTAHRPRRVSRLKACENEIIAGNRLVSSHLAIRELIRPFAAVRITGGRVPCSEIKTPHQMHSLHRLPLTC